MEQASKQGENTSSREGHASGIRVRSWTAADIPRIREITWATWREAYSAFIPLPDMQEYFELHYSLSALESLMARPCVDGFVAEVDGKAVGYLKTHDEPAEGRFYVSSVYVLPGFQGRGLGGRLMEVAAVCAREHGSARLWLGVMVQNAPAIAWYTKQGFQFVEELPFTMGSTTVNHLIGFKSISPS